MLTGQLGSGALAGLASCVFLQPLDLIKTRLQEEPAAFSFHNRFKSVCTKIWQTGGVGPTLIRTVPGTALYFALLAHLQYLALGASGLCPGLIDNNTGRPTPFSNIFIGGTARSLAGFVLMPATVIKVRYESKNFGYRSVSNAIKNIWAGEGTKGFFRGFGATALRDAPHAGIYVAFYETSKRSFAGFMATLITQPFDLIKTRIQLTPDKYHNFIQTFLLVLREDGVKGFLSGIAPRLVRKSLSSAITWTVYEEITRIKKSSQ